MAPRNNSNTVGVGLWGEPTTTWDWCEDNYEVSFSNSMVYRVGPVLSTKFPQISDQISKNVLLSKFLRKKSHNFIV